MEAAIICAIDGTLAIDRDRGPYEFELCREDLLNVPIHDIVKIHAHNGLTIILVSSREDKFRKLTEDWLFWHDVQYKELLMRATGDNRRDDTVKLEIFETHIRGKYDIRFVLDDRNRTVEMWRQLGLTCLQVADGNF